MPAFEILCATMRQTDFSKIKEMNIHSDVVFANQADRTELAETLFDGHWGRMLTTTTRGVGINRNIALMYAQGEICLFADDDVRYCDDMEPRILAEFAAHPDADIIIFHLESMDDSRPQIRYPKTRKIHPWNRMPWGSCRVAFRLDSIRKANLWFTTLFGGGCVFPSGEDSMWLDEARKRGLVFYVSNQNIGRVYYDESTWFTGYDEKYYFGQGAYYQAARPKTIGVWMIYSLYRTRDHRELSVLEKIKWMNLGRKGYKNMKGYNDALQDTYLGKGM